MGFNDFTKLSANHTYKVYKTINMLGLHITMLYITLTT